MSNVSSAKGYISFRASSRSVAFVLIRYGAKNETLASFKYEELEARSCEIELILSAYPDSEMRWRKFCRSKLPKLLEGQLARSKTLSYKQIEKTLEEIVFTLERSKTIDKKGTKGGVELGEKIWVAWQTIRTVISSSTYWNVKEEEALVSLGVRSKK